jgi:hypothetical protein
MSKRPKPVALCTICGASSYDATLINGECGRMVGAERCSGTNKREMRKTDWKECTVCSATGLVRTGTCERCDGVGWLFVREHRR